MTNSFLPAMDLAENDSVYFIPSFYESGGRYESSLSLDEVLGFQNFVIPPMSQCGTDWD